MRFAWTSCLLATAVTTALAEIPVFEPVPAVEPAKAAASFHVLEGFSMRLLAAEPLVTDPVSITYDENGRAYVCEMTDYPYTDKAGHKPSQENPTDLPIGKVRLLDDKDGDGVFDTSTIFAEGLSWPTGAACWKGGIFVTATPDLWYLKDTDGDGRADVREKIYTGFKKLNVQAVMNNPAWGLDHRLYVAGGSNGASVTRPDAPEFKPVLLKRNDFSFEPGSRALRVESGGARFGLSFNDWGERFLCNIRNPCQHVTLPWRFLLRNPYLTVNPLTDCAEAGDQLPVYRTSPVEPWRDFRAKRWTAEGSHLPKSELVGAGVVTSSAGVTCYRGDAYPAEYRQFAFVADVAGNLFYRMKLEEDGLTFKATQVDGRKNFCTSDDVWFRPVNFVNAPDGCLHVCDMYREVIEHPWSIPDDIHAALDLLRGADKGRLWRLEPAGFKPRATPRLGEAGTAELVELLDHPNAWHRETAHRLLFERQDKSALPRVRALVKQARTPQGRVHALWTLEGLGDLGPGTVADYRQPGRLSAQSGSADRQAWLKEAGITQAGYGLLLEASMDPDAHVRRQAVRLRPEALLAPRDVGELYTLRPDAARLLDDPDPAVRLEAVLSHSVIFSPAAYPHIGRLCVAHRAEPQMLQAALLAAAESSFTLLQTVLRAPEASSSPALRGFLAEGAAMVGRAWKKGDPDAPYHVMKQLAARGPADALAKQMVAALAQALRRSGSSLEEAVVQSFRESRDEASLRWLEKLHADVLAGLESNRTTPEENVLLLGLVPDLLAAKAAIPRLDQFFSASSPAEVQTAALAALGAYRAEPGVAAFLLRVWPGLSPALREQALGVLLTYPDRVAALLEALEAGTVPAAQVSAAARAALMKHKDPALAGRASALFSQGQGNRQEVLARYQAALATPGDAARGEKVYELACMVCHRHKEKGNDVGPNLGTVQAWTPDQLLTNILDPNREVSPNFALYLVETQDGRSLSGLIASEAAGNLTLKRADGGTEQVRRAEIKSLSSPGVSLMPEGLEAAITPAQMADLIAFLTRRG